MRVGMFPNGYFVMWEITLNSTNCIVSTDLFVWPVFNSFRADADRFVRVLKNMLLSEQISAVSSQTT